MSTKVVRDEKNLHVPFSCFFFLFPPNNRNLREEIETKWICAVRKTQIRLWQKISFERHEMNKYIDNNKTGTRESIWILRHFKHNLTRPKPINLFKKNVFVVNNECLKKKLYQLNVLSETSVNYIVLSDITINFDRVEKYERDMWQVL